MGTYKFIQVDDPKAGIRWLLDCHWSREYMGKLRQNVNQALNERDSKFGDYRIAERKK